MVFAAKGGIYTGALRGAHIASAAILYNSRGRSPQPVREASADPGQNPGSPGPSGPAAGSTLTPVRACQPSGIQESAAPPTGIYRHLNHLRFLPRSFAGAQDDVGGRDSPIPTSIPIPTPVPIPYSSNTPFLFNISHLYSINHSHMQKTVIPSDSPLFSFDFL